MEQQSDDKHKKAQRIGRLGYIAYGLLQLILAALALQIAWSSTSDKASTSGAIANVAQQPAGRVLVWIVALGLLMLASWQLYVAIRENNGLRQTAGAVVSAIAYGAVAVVAFRFAIGSSEQSNSNQTSEQAAGTILGLPGGRWLVAAVALAIIGVGVWHVLQGITGRFAEDLESGATAGTSGSVVMGFGRLGYGARGVAYMVMGGLFVAAAVTSDKDEAGSLDAALSTLKQQPAGRWLLTVVAIGFAAYGLYSFARARYEAE